MQKQLFSGKFEKINGQWYPVKVLAYDAKEAIKMLYVGQQKSYGIIEAIKGRFTVDN